MNVVLKRLRELDLEMVMVWRQLPEVTRYMNTDVRLSIEKQKAWFENLKNDSTKICWVINYEGIPIGVLNLSQIDLKGNSVEWGYYVAEKQYSSIKLVAFLEWNLYDYVFEILKLNRVDSRTLAQNKWVVLLHEKCGAKFSKVLKNHVIKSGKYYDVYEYAMTLNDWIRIRRTISYDKFEFEQ